MTRFRFVLLFLLVAFGFVGVSFGCKWIAYETASLLVLALTGVALIAYTWDTHRIAEITEAQLLESQRPRVGVELVAGPSGSDFIVTTRVINMSDMFCQVWTKFEMTIYGKVISHSARYDGTEPWLLSPKFSAQGWFSISDVLGKAGKNLANVLADTGTPEQEKFSIKVTIRAEGTPGGETKYPPLQWYVRLDQTKIACVYQS